MSYLEKIRQAIDAIPVRDGLTKDEYLQDFKMFVESNVTSRLHAMDEWCARVSKTFQTLPDHKVVAEQDRFSQVFETRVTELIDLWLRQDEGLRNRYGRICRAFGRKLDIQSLQNALQETLRSLHEDIQYHVNQANHQGKDWTTRIDAAGITILNPVVRNTISWFSQLTVEEVNQDYRRDLKL